MNGEAASPRARASAQDQAGEQRTNGAQRGRRNRRTREHAEDDETQESELSQRCGNHDGSVTSDTPLRQPLRSYLYTFVSRGTKPMRW